MQCSLIDSIDAPRKRDIQQLLVYGCDDDTGRVNDEVLEFIALNGVPRSTSLQLLAELTSRDIMAIRRTMVLACQVDIGMKVCHF